MLREINIKDGCYPWGCRNCEYSEDKEDVTRAIDYAVQALSKQCASSEQADKSVIVDFVAFQREWLKTHKIMELNPVDEVMTEIFLGETGKAFIDSLGQTAENDEDRTSDNEGPKLFGKRTIIEPGEQFIGEDLLKKALDQSADSAKMIKLKKRTITERLIIAESLINSVIVDSDNDQFREDTKKTDDVLINLPSAQPETNCSEIPNNSDTISRQDAVSRRRLLSDLKELITAWEKYPVMAEQIKGVEVAIGYVELIPSAQPEINTDEDTISRQQTIDALMQEFRRIPTNSIRAKLVVENLPSAQPERTCVNCGRTANNGGWYADGGTRCPIEEHYALPKDGFCHLWEKRNVTDDDYPERQKNEQV